MIETGIHNGSWITDQIQDFQVEAKAIQRLNSPIPIQLELLNVAKLPVILKQSLSHFKVNTGNLYGLNWKSFAGV